MTSLPAMLDIEASGLGRGSYPIEIGFVGADGGLFCCLIQPVPEWTHWDASAEALHGISRRLLTKHGKAPSWVAAQINDRLRGQTAFCDGWANDYSWLARLFDIAQMLPSFKLQDVRTLLNEDEAQRWHEVTSQVRAERQLARHRASSDALVLQLALQRLKRPSEGQLEVKPQLVAPASIAVSPR